MKSMQRKTRGQARIQGHELQKGNIHHCYPFCNAPAQTAATRAGSSFASELPQAKSNTSWAALQTYLTLDDGSWVGAGWPSVYCSCRQQPTSASVAPACSLYFISQFMSGWHPELPAVRWYKITSRGCFGELTLAEQKQVQEQEQSSRHGPW